MNHDNGKFNIPMNVPDLSKINQRATLQVFPTVNVIGVTPKSPEEALQMEALINEARMEIAKIMQKFQLCRIDAFLGIM